MKKVVISLCLVISTLCYAQDVEWKLIKDSKAYDGYFEYVKIFEKESILKAKDTFIAEQYEEIPYSYGVDVKNIDSSRLIIDAEAVIPNGTQDVLDEKLLTPALSRQGKTWFNAHSIPILQSKNRETARQFERKALELEDKAGEGYWYDNPYTGEDMDLFQVIISMRGIATLADFYIIDTVKYNTHYTLTVLCNKWDYLDSTIAEDQQPIEGEKTTLLVYPDGEYIDIYVGTTNNYLWSFVQVDEEYQKQFWSLIRPGIWYQDNVFNLSKVTFPRRADKNHTIGTTCIVAERLRLRKEEHTTSTTLQTMQTGTQVKILQLGKKQTIDGITANWVQVELNDGTKGWCFGGYLVEK